MLMTVSIAVEMGNLKIHETMKCVSEIRILSGFLLSLGIENSLRDSTESLLLLCPRPFTSRQRHFALCIK